MDAGASGAAAVAPAAAAPAWMARVSPMIRQLCEARGLKPAVAHAREHVGRAELPATPAPARWRSPSHSCARHLGHLRGCAALRPCRAAAAAPLAPRPRAATAQRELPAPPAPPAQKAPAHLVAAQLVAALEYAMVSPSCVCASSTRSFVVRQPTCEPSEAHTCDQLLYTGHERLAPAVVLSLSKDWRKWHALLVITACAGYAHEPSAHAHWQSAAAVWIPH